MSGLKEVTLYEVTQRKVVVDGDSFSKVIPKQVKHLASMQPPTYGDWMTLEQIPVKKIVRYVGSVGSQKRIEELVVFDPDVERVFRQADMDTQNKLRISDERFADK